MAVVGAQQMQLPSLNQLLESCQHSSARTAASLLPVCYSCLFSLCLGVQCLLTDCRRNNEEGILSFCPHVHVLLHGNTRKHTSQDYCIMFDQSKCLCAVMQRNEAGRGMCNRPWNCAVDQNLTVLLCVHDYIGLN